MKIAALLVTLFCSTLYLTAAPTQKPADHPRTSASPTPTPEPCYCVPSASTEAEAGCKDGLRVAYYQKEVDKKAVLTARIPTPDYTDEARAHNVTGVVRLRVVLCPSGRVSNISVILGLPDGLIEKAITAVKGVKFRSAEKGYQKVAQFQLFEFYFGN